MLIYITHHISNFFVLMFKGEIETNPAPTFDSNGDIISSNLMLFEL